MGQKSNSCRLGCNKKSDYSISKHILFILGWSIKASYCKRNKGETISKSKGYLENIQLKCTAFNIGGNNYFKLRDIAKITNFGVGWDAKENTIVLDSSTDNKD